MRRDASKSAFPALRGGGNVSGTDRFGGEPVFIVHKKARMRPRRSLARPESITKNGLPKSLQVSSLEEISTLSKFKESISKGARERRRSKYGSSLQSPQDGVRDKDPLKRGLKRLRVAAERSLQSSRDTMGLKSFEGKPLSPDEFRHKINTGLNVRLDDDELAALVVHFDKDGDGTVDYREVADMLLHPEKLQVGKMRTKSAAEHFVIAMNKVREACSKEDKTVNIEDVFAKFDNDGDGDISRQEFMDVMQDMGVDLERYELYACFKYLDPSGDGRVLSSEFAYAYYNRRELERSIKKRSAKRLRPPFKPYGVKGAIPEEKDRFLNSGVAYVPSRYTGRSSIHYHAEEGERRTSPSRRWISGSNAAKDRVDYFLDSPDSMVIKAQRDFIKISKARNREKFFQRFERPAVKSLPKKVRVSRP